jgi:hypothetical protein
LQRQGAGAAGRAGPPGGGDFRSPRTGQPCRPQHTHTTAESRTGPLINNLFTAILVRLLGIPYLCFKYNAMKKHVLSILAFGLSLSAFAQNCSNIFISEYVEGSGNNKALEIYNPTNNPVDLGSYRLIRYDNGKNFGEELINPDMILSFPAGTIVAPKDVYVFALNQTDPLGTGQTAPIDTALQSKTDALYCDGCAPGNNSCRTMCFNGDDALALQQMSEGGTYINVDIFACVGERPSNNTGGFSPTAGWTILPPFSSMPNNYDSNTQGPYFLQYWTQNKTLIRKPNVTQGVSVNPNPQSFDASVQWDSIPEDSFDSLGTHVCDCNFMTLETAPEAFTKISPNPTDKVLHVRAETNMRRILIRNLTGQVVVAPLAVSGLQASLNVESLSSAMYLIEIQYESGLVRSQRFSKR